MRNKLNDIYIATFSKGAEEVSLEYGFGLELNDLCISQNLEPDKRRWVIDRMQGEMSRAGSLDRKNIIHGPFTELTPSAIDPRAIALMKERYESTISICKELGINDLVLHDGYIPLIYQKPWHIKKSVEFWKALGEILPDDLTIYIENVFDDEPETLCQIVDGTNDALGHPKGEEKYKICLDVGHANAMSFGGTENILNWIKVMGRRIGHLHLHNNDGTGDLHNDVNDGTVNMERILQGIEESCESDVTMTIESREALKSAEFLKEYYGR